MSTTLYPHSTCGGEEGEDAVYHIMATNLGILVIMDLIHHFVPLIFTLSLSPSPCSDYGARPSPRPDAVWLRTGDCAEHCPSRRPVYWSSALSVISFVVLTNMVLCSGRSPSIGHPMFDRYWRYPFDSLFCTFVFMEWSLCFQSLFHFEVCGIFY